MDLNKIPTAEEFYRQTTGCVMNHGDIKKAMIEFAKLHIEAALKTANLEMFKFVDEKEDDDYKPQILNSYPLENIK